MDPKKHFFLKNPPGFLAFEKSSSKLTSNRPFWLKQIYRDIKFILRGLPERCDVKQEVKTEFWKLSFLFAFFFFSCQRFTHWLPIWVRVQSVSPDMILTDCFFLHINSSLTQPPPYHQYNHHHHHSSATKCAMILRTYFDIFLT